MRDVFAASHLRVSSCWYRSDLANVVLTLKKLGIDDLVQCARDPNVLELSL